ncbi:hypothetical protein Q3G72_008413 [Acer saccharum]|nr:hypothetical protein Q3G72_008413 [Acer saccharum]
MANYHLVTQRGNLRQLGATLVNEEEIVAGDPGGLFNRKGMRRLDEMDGDLSKKRKRNSGLGAGTSREFEEIEPEAEPKTKPTDVLGSDDDA